MKKSTKLLSIVIMLMIAVHTLLPITADVDNVNSYSKNTKSVFESYSFISQGSAILAHDNKYSNKLLKSIYQGFFSIRDFHDSYTVTCLYTKKISIDLRKKIKETLSNQFYGSKYILISLFEYE